ncbi:hypothetical protein SKAU_G00097880 [Synaphobranchus kaupii]|uniref:PiggyBac transposable element-derived protein 4-like n=1 Tax=Synaphobranchus kaupii TaxID=118154 RepID=A0A9Q1FYW3_SYNKA|nr:hypothetical protein SKAU_G00097880 [Synaphobranchus kaupii]
MGLRAPLTCTHHLSLNTSIRVSENSISELEYRRRINMFTNSRRRELTDEEIREIFFNSDDEGDYNTESSGSDSDSEERLPPNLVSLERNPELGEGDDDVEENPEEGPSVVPCSRPEGPVPVEEVRSSDWRTAVDFTPPGPGIEFDSSISGVQNPPETPTAVNCFKMFLSVETVGEIVEETNRYASEQQGKTAIGVIGKLSKWVPTCLNEVYTFLAIALLMGLVRKSTLREYWSTDPVLLTPFFASVFSQDRFLNLLRCLHFVNPAHADTRDPLNKIRNVFNALTSAFKRSFIPYKDLCVDESLMLWKGRLGFRQYIPSKRHRFGIKFFVLCDVVTGYVQDMVIYTGATTSIESVEGLGVSGSVVMTLLAPHLGKGHVLYVDNWYSSPTLFQHLLHQGTGACGTVRLNRRGMPTFPKKMKRGEVTFRENGTQLAVKWQDKRDVNFLTTVHPSSMAQSGRLDHFTGEPKVKPACVLDYNKKMGAVDRADMITSFVDCARKSTKWYKKLFFHLLDTAVLNAYTVHRKLSEERMPYKDFRLKLVKELIQEHPLPRRSTGGRPCINTPLRLTGRHFPSFVPPTEAQGQSTRRHCRVCLYTTRRKRERKLTRYTCSSCDTALCPAPCFEEFHTLKNY